MEDVYTLSDPLKAHLIAHRLEQEGIKSWINGEQLASMASGIPILAAIRISVPGEDAVRARAIILHLEKEMPETETSVHAKTLPATMANSLLFLVTGMALPAAAVRKGRGMQAWRLLAVLIFIVVLASFCVAWAGGR